jgi:LysR family hydrogen peroxide-inducible transcriptional activator
MTLTQLRYLVAVAETGHFAEAAQRCGVTQPTLSMQLQKLERSLGIVLFDRRKKPVEPTEAGATLVAQARRVLHECARLEGLAQEARGTLTGELRLGILPTLAPYLLPLVVPRFMQRYPGVHLRVREVTTTQLIDEITGDKLDLGLASDHEAHAALLSRPLFSEPFVAFVAPEHRLAPYQEIPTGALRVSDMWLLSEGHCLRDQTLRLCQEGELACGVGRALHFESGSLQTLVKLVQQSGGMTLLPFLATLDLSDSERRTYLRPLAPTPQRVVRALTSRDYGRRSLCRAFIETVAAVLPEPLRDQGSTG